jgi:general stress protein 26
LTEARPRRSLCGHHFAEINGRQYSESWNINWHSLCDAVDHQQFNHEHTRITLIMTPQPFDKLHDLLNDFDMAMLVTRNAEGQLRSRPMALAEVADDGALWFITQRHSGKADDISHDRRVNVSLQSSMKFISLCGSAELVDDRSKVSELWSEAWKVWFPHGKDDPTFTLLRIRGECAEYWDNSGASGIKYLFEAGKAYLTGTRPDVADDPKIHAKVQM